MRSLLLLALALVACNAVEMHNAHQEIAGHDLGMYASFNSFAERHNKVYSNKEEVLERFTVYKSNHMTMSMYQQQEQGSAVYGETQFMDLTPEEFSKIMLPFMNQDPTAKTCPKATNNAAPEAFDWRNKSGVVSSIKNQGSCGSCWAFSVVGNIEGQWRLRKNQEVILSEQELLDCDHKDQGCNGGFPVWAYEEIQRLGGLETEEEYPYRTRSGGQCAFRKDHVAASITDFCQVEKNEETIKNYLAEHGPLSIAVNANPLQFYYGGIHYPWSIFCSKRGLNHAVLLVGYGQEGNKPYWIIKNSWGTSWGEQGYYRLYRGKNVCGVSEMVTTAIIA